MPQTVLVVDINKLYILNQLHLDFCKFDFTCIVGNGYLYVISSCLDLLQIDLLKVKYVNYKKTSIVSLNLFCQVFFNFRKHIFIIVSS